MSGDIDLGTDEKIGSLVRALANLVEQVPVDEFAVIGGLAVLAALQGAHRVTDDVDTVAEQHGDEPTAIDLVLASPNGEVPGRLKIDCIAVGDTPASELSASDLPDEDLDRAFILSHRWAFDTAELSTLVAHAAEGVVIRASCRFAHPSAIVAMKLQAAPRRPSSRSYKAGGDYYDLYRILSHPNLVRPVADALRRAPHDLGEWCVAAIRSWLIDEADRTAAVVARSGVAGRQAPSAAEIREAGLLFMDLWKGTD